MIKLYELRQIKGITQQNLANSIGVKNYTIGNWEQGRAEPSIADLIALSDIFNCSVDYLVGREDDFGAIRNSFDVLDNEREIVLKYRQLPEDKKKLIAELINDIYLVHKK